MPWEKYSIILCILVKNLQAQLNHKKRDKAKLRNILQNNCPAFFKSVKVMKDKEKTKELLD